MIGEILIQPLVPSLVDSPDGSELGIIAVLRFDNRDHTQIDAGKMRPSTLEVMRFSVTGALLARGGKRPYTGGPAGPFVYRLGREIFNLERRVRLP